MNIDSLVDRILDSYEKYGLINRNDIENFPNRQNVVSVLQDLQSLILPGFKAAEDIEPLNIRFITGQKVNNIIAKLTREIQKSLIYTISKVKGNSDNIENSHCFKLAERTSIALIEEIPELRRKIQLDTIAAYNGDPAAESYDEIICCYPVIKAMINYRVAHKMLSLGISLIPRIITEKAHSETGIDIHPAASIGHHFTIDHGTGVVIGATCIIGNNVKLYQGVTLGAKSFPLDEKGNPIKGIPRHPIIEDDVIIYSNSTVLGRITIGRGSIIGGNLWVTKGTEPGEKLMQNDKTKS